MRTGCIYRIWNTINSKSYIGQTIKIERRIIEHFTKTNCPCLSNAINKYGKDVFQHEVIEDGIPQHYLNDREIYWINHFNTIVPNGYNLTYGGLGGTPSIETRRKLSEARKGENNHNYGKSPSPETRRKISDSLRGKKLSAETKKKISGVNNHTYGKSLSPEHCRKLSEAHKGKSLSPEHRRKLSEARKGENNPMYGKSQSPKTRRKISEAHKGKSFSPEHRRKLSEAHKRRHKKKSSNLH